MRKTIFASLAVLAVSACGGTSESSDEASTEASTETADAPADEMAEAPSETPITSMQAPASAPVDPIRGPGGMEENCLARVNETVGGDVIGTNRIEEAESGIMIYVNVQGAAAPWQCFGSRDGTISEVYFGGDEGAL